MMQIGHSYQIFTDYIPITGKPSRLVIYLFNPITISPFFQNIHPDWFSYGKSGCKLAVIYLLFLNLPIGKPFFKIYIPIGFHMVNRDVN